MEERVWRVVSVNEYVDDVYVYRHWHLGPRRALCSLVPRRLMSVPEWSRFVKQSGAWEHYAVHGPEPHVLMFRKRRRAV